MDKINTIKEFLETFKERPGMFVWDPDYWSAMAYLIGYNDAKDGELLDGFNDWLVVENGFGESLVLQVLCLHIVLTENERNKLEKNRDHINMHLEAISKVCDLLLIFHKNKENKKNGT